MAALGTLQPNREGGWTGSVFVLAHDVKVRLVPNDNQENSKAPAFRIYAGEAELGAFWRNKIREDTPRDFLSGDFDFPGLEAPISVAAFFSDDDKRSGLCGIASGRRTMFRRIFHTGNALIPIGCPLPNCGRNAPELPALIGALLAVFQYAEATRCDQVSSQRYILSAYSNRRDFGRRQTAGQLPRASFLRLQYNGFPRQLH